MRIAFVYDLIYPYSKGGVEKRVSDLASALAHRGHETHIFGTKQWEGKDRISVDRVVLHGVGSSTSFYAGGGRRSLWQAISFAFALARRLAFKRFDVIDIQAMSPLSSLVALVISRARRTTSIVTWHEVWNGYWFEYLGVLGLAGWVAERSIARLGTAHAAVSTTTMSRMDLLGVEGAVSLPNGIDLELIDSILSSVETSDVIYVGRLVEHKNLELLIEAARLLKLRGIEPRIEIIGDGPLRLELEGQADNLDNVGFRGLLDTHQAVISRLKSARVFALPSIREGFGLAALEALACGLPVITVDHPQNATTDIVRSGYNGVVVPLDAAAFANAIIMVLTDDSLREELATNAYASALPYDLDSVVTQVESAYAELSDVDVTQASSPIQHRADSPNQPAGPERKRSG